jgi:hypothetical protein
MPPAPSRPKSLLRVVQRGVFDFLCQLHGDHRHKHELVVFEPTEHKPELCRPALHLLQPHGPAPDVSPLLGPPQLDCGPMRGAL